MKDQVYYQWYGARIVIRLRFSAQEVHAFVRCFRRSGLAQAGETHVAAGILTATIGHLLHS